MKLNPRNGSRQRSGQRLGRVRFDDSVHRSVSPGWTGDGITFTPSGDGFLLLVTADGSLNEFNELLVDQELDFPESL
jgi:hypothetical protein